MARMRASAGIGIASVWLAMVADWYVCDQEVDAIDRDVNTDVAD